MKNKKIFIWILIMAVAILVSAAIIFQPALIFAGVQNFQKNKEVSVEELDSPEMVVHTFYTWYLDYIGDRAAGTFKNPIEDQAYHENEHLALSFIDHIDEVVEEMEGYSGYDPFLCAQDIPTEMNSIGTFLHGGQASVVVQSSFSNHYVTVDLQKSGDQWQISNITCSNNPAGTTKAFYTWYLAYIGDRSAGEMRNPLVDKVYQEVGFLSERLIQEFDELTADGIAADPILLAQDIPQDFSVDLSTEDTNAIVHLQFGSQIVHHLKVSLVQELGAWKIDSIEQAR